tara:strand:+ start:3760 stop:5031 length:1272 start_codon:yes stop_codon:yes gene_type:complete
MENLKSVFAYFQPSCKADQVLSQARVAPVVLELAISKVGDKEVAWGLELSQRSLAVAKSKFSYLDNFPDMEVLRSLELLILQLLVRISGQDVDVGLSESMRAMAYKAVRMDVYFESIAQGIREIQGLWTREIFDSLDIFKERENISQLIVMLATVFDDAVKDFFEGCLAEKELLLEESLVSKRRLVEELIEGGSPVAPEVVEVFKSNLGVDPDKFYTAIIMSSVRAASRATKYTQRAIGEHISNSNLVHVPQSDGAWLWIATNTLPLKKQIYNLTTSLKSAEVGIYSLGETARGVEGFRRSHVQARALLEVGKQYSVDRVLQWPKYAATAIFIRNKELTDWFVKSTLGELVSTDQKIESYRETLKSYLLSGNSLLHAAESQSIHRNTVVYRLQAVEDILGKPIKEFDFSLSFALALLDLKPRE